MTLTSTDPTAPDWSWLHAFMAGDLRPAWHAEAACRGMGPADFYSGYEVGRGHHDEPTPDLWRALDTCRGCPVAAECREAGDGERWGVWGGLLPAERGYRRMRRRA